MNTIEPLYENNNYPNWAVYNMDETMLSFKENYKQKVIVEINGKKPVKGFMADGQHITCVMTISAAGNSVNPLLITKNKTDLNFNDEVHNAFGLVYQTNGWIDTPIFEDYIENMFIPHVESTRRYYESPYQRCVLFLDQHSTRNSEKVKNLLYDNNIDYVLLPAHSSTIMQPLDLTVFGAFKSFLTKDLLESNITLDNTFSSNNRNILLNFTENALREACSTRNCRKGFEKAGLFPFCKEKPLGSNLLKEKTSAVVKKAGHRNRLDQGIVLPNIIPWSNQFHDSLDNYIFEGHEDDDFIYYEN